MLVEVEDAVDLDDEPVGEAEVSVCRSDNRGESCRVSETGVTRVGVRETLCDDGGGLLHERDFQPMNLMPLLYFTPSLSIEELDAGIATRVQVIDDALAMEQAMIERSETVGPSHVTEIFRLTWHGLRADRDWCNEFRGRLTGGRPSSGTT